MVLDKHHVFYDLMHRRCRYKVYWGGRGSGKSYAFAEALVRKCVRQPLRVLCAREFQNSMADSVHRLLKDTITRLGLDAFFVVTATSIKSACGAEFIFRGLHGAEQTLRSLANINICWVEEAQTVSKYSWESLLPTVRGPDSEVWVSFNMINETDATYQRFVVAEAAKNPERYCVHKVNYDTNPFFAGTTMYADMLDDKANDQHLYEHIWLGFPMVMDDSIIFSGKYVVETFSDELWKDADRLFFGVDWGFANDPMAFVRMFILEQADGRHLYISHEAYGHRIDIVDYPQFFDSMPDAHNWPLKADAARPELISHVKSALFYNIAAAEKWDGSVKDGIAHIRGFRKVHIHTRCVHTAEEAILYKYKVDPNTKDVLPIIIDKHNHCWDAVRYGLDGYIQRSGSLGIWHELGKAA